MSIIMIDQHKKRIKNNSGYNFSANAFATGAGMIVWLMLFSIMGWSVVSEPQPPMRPYLSYPEKQTMLKTSKEQMAKADRAFIDDMEITGRMKTKEAKRK